MVSGKTSKAARKSRPVVVAAPRRNIPWGLIAGVTVVALFAGVVFGYAFMRNEENKAQAEALAPFTPTAENQDPAAAIPGVVVQPFEGGLHVDRATQVAYTFSPPIGGAHDYSWATCNGVVYDEAIRSETAVHSLEHGAVWLTYRTDLADGDVARLKEIAQSDPYVLVSPYEDLAAPVVATAWGVQLEVDSVDDERLDAFLARYVQGEQTPEPGAPCSGGVGTPAG